MADSPLSPSGPESRCTSVWGKGTDGLRRSIDKDSGQAAEPLRSSVSSDQANERRREAAQFIMDLTGQQVPYSLDASFRAPLRDGVILWKVLKRVLPNKVHHKVVEPSDAAGEAGRAQAARQNVPAFLGELQNLQIPSSCVFSEQDLQSEDFVDRPRVTDCLLWLKKLLNHRDVVPSPMQQCVSDTLQVRDSPSKRLSTADSLNRSLHGAFSRIGPPAGGAAGRLPASAGFSLSSPGGADAADLLDPKMSIQMQSMLIQGLQAQLGPSTTLVVPAMPAALVAPGPNQQFVPMNQVKNLFADSLMNIVKQYEDKHKAKDAEVAAINRQFQHCKQQYDNIRHALDSLQNDVERQRQDDRAQSEARIKELQAEKDELVSRYQQQLQQRDQQLAAAGQDNLVQELQQQLEALQGIEQRYSTVLEENRALYNQVQDLRGAIRVFCRIRPAGTTGDTSSTSVSIRQDGEVAVTSDRGEGNKSYRVDRVFSGDSTQQQIYIDVQPLIRSVMDGYNVCILAYGQTGSGKTHTMTGTNVATTAGRGINYRALDDLFALRDERSGEVQYTIKVQMLEVYCETLRDLLSADQSNANKLTLLSTKRSGLNVPNAVQIEVNTPDDVIAMMDAGSRNRHAAETKMNERSSRSHQVLTVIVDGHNVVTGARSHACLHLVDLAGSERTSKSGAEGDRMREAKDINKSLTELTRVMLALKSKDKHIPFRDGLLPRLLQDSLSGNAKCMMFIHVAPEGSSSGETMQTLQFGSDVSQVSLGKAKANTDGGKADRLQELEEMLQRQKDANSSLSAQLEKSRAEQAALQKRLEQAAKRPTVTCSQERDSGTAGTPYGAESPYQTPMSSVCHEPASSSADAVATPASNMQRAKTIGIQQLPRPTQTPRGVGGAPRTPVHPGPMAMATPVGPRSTASTPRVEPPHPEPPPPPLEAQASRGNSAMAQHANRLSSARHKGGVYQGAVHAPAVAVAAVKPQQQQPMAPPPAAAAQRAGTGIPRPSDAAGTTSSVSARPSGRYGIAAAINAVRSSVTSRTSGVFSQQPRPQAAPALPTVNDVPAAAKPQASSRMSGGWKK